MFRRPPSSPLFPSTPLFRSPGYHLRAAAAAHAAGVPVLYYIAPQLWAWAPGRVRRLAAVSRLAVILPFEETFFRERSEEHTSELQSQSNIVCRLLLEKKKKI